METKALRYILEHGLHSAEYDQAAAELKELEEQANKADEYHISWLKQVNATVNVEKELDDLRAQLAQANEYGDHWQEIAQAETKKLEAAQEDMKSARSVIDSYADTDDGYIAEGWLSTHPEEKK